MKKQAALFLLMTLSAQAACEGEHGEALEYEGKCNTANDITVACGIAAAATFVFHFGIGGAFCAAPAANASETCKFKDQRWEKYNNCIASSIQKEQEEAKKKEERMIAMLDAKAEAESTYYQSINDYIRDLNDQGIDPEHEDNKDEVHSKLDGFKAVYEEKIKVIEESNQ